MMRILTTLLLAVSLSSCGLMKYVPSFNDANQSTAIINVRAAVERLDCAKPQYSQAVAIQDSLTWFVLYSESKGARQTDVLDLVKPLQETVGDFVKRTEVKDGSVVYCQLKKKVMQAQAGRASEVIIGRF